MRLIPINSLMPGMKLARKIYNEDGVVLLSENAELTESIIRKLRSYGLNFVYVVDSRTEDVEPIELIEEETRRRALNEIRTIFRKWAEPGVKGLTYPYLGKTFSKLVEDILNDLSSRENVMIMLMNMNSMDYYLYRHSLNVCIYTLMLGQVHGYSKDELVQLGLGALLHDIGKVRLPAELLDKPGRLTDAEYEEIKKHSEIGFKMLKDEPGISLSSAHCAYQHHERLDGSGYPRGLKGTEISEFARWIAIVDSYDAMTTHRTYRSPLLPHQALEVLYTGCDSLYEKSKLELFRDRVAIYPPGMTVKLNTGEWGVVVRIDALYPSRPVVRVLTDPFGDDLKIPYEVDLSKQLSLIITEVDGIEGID